MGAWCHSVTCSPCGRYVLAGGGQNVVVADSITGAVLKQLKGHSGTLHCVRFVAGSQTIVSASADKTIAVWEWEKSNPLIKVLEGHDGWVRSVAVR